MSYYFSKIVELSFDRVVPRVTEVLASKGFGVLTAIDVQATLKKKIGADFRPYMILGACNPQFAHRALLSEDKIGTMLPCNVVVQELSVGRLEVAAVDPVASMSAVRNPELEPIAAQVRELLKQVISEV